MTHMIMHLILMFNLAIVPVFYPKISGIHNAQMTVTNSPAWHNILYNGNLEQPDGFMIIWSGSYG